MASKVRIKVNGKSYNVDLADGFISRAKGLSFRNEGKMLFKFPYETNTSIDMMFLSEPLYLYFIDSGKRLIETQKAEPWSFDPRTWNLYSPDRPYRYLLESFEKIEVDVGDRLEFDLG